MSPASPSSSQPHALRCASAAQRAPSAANAASVSRWQDDRLSVCSRPPAAATAAMPASVIPRQHERSSTLRGGARACQGPGGPACRAERMQAGVARACTQKQHLPSGARLQLRARAAHQPRQRAVAQVGAPAQADAAQRAEQRRRAADHAVHLRSQRQRGSALPYPCAAEHHSVGRTCGVAHLAWRAPRGPREAQGVHLPADDAAPGLTDARRHLRVRPRDKALAHILPLHRLPAEPRSAGSAHAEQQLACQCGAPPAQSRYDKQGRQARSHRAMMQRLCMHACGDGAHALLASLHME